MTDCSTGRFARVQKVRPIAEPNAGFAAQLLQLQRRLGLTPDKSKTKLASSAGAGGGAGATAADAPKS